MALAIRERGNTDIWIADPGRQTISRLTTEPTIETMPTWTAAGDTVAFRSEREGPGLFRRDAQGAGPIERLTSTDGPIHSPTRGRRTGGRCCLRSSAASAIRPSPASRRPIARSKCCSTAISRSSIPTSHPTASGWRISPTSPAASRVYVRPYPAVDKGRWQISTDGGISPRWNPDDASCLSELGGPHERGDGSRIHVLGGPAPPAVCGEAVRRTPRRRLRSLSGRPTLPVHPGRSACGASSRTARVVHNWVAELSARLAPAR